MRFEHLTLTNFRCLEHCRFEPAAAETLVVGANGSGKTSLLEAMTMAALGRSFQPGRPGDLIRRGQPGLSVRAGLQNDEESRFEVAVRKTASQTMITLDGMAVPSASALAQRVPLVVLGSKMADVLGDSPGNRRSLVDRTMIHVEPSYITAWKTFRQALRQRNELLRNAGSVEEAGYWHAVMAKAATAIDERRAAVVAWLNDGLAACRIPGFDDGFRFAYRPGWEREAGLVACLTKNWERDRRLGHTQDGIHRADFRLLADERPVVRRLSRGQAKYVAATVYVGLAGFIAQQRGCRPVLLIDDLAAELDDKMRTRAVELIATLGGQRVFTAIRQTELPEIGESLAPVFHVEQGEPVRSR